MSPKTIDWLMIKCCKVFFFITKYKEIQQKHKYLEVKESLCFFYY